MSVKQKSDLAENRERIFVVDNQPLMRIAVADWISRTDDLELCGEADNAASALKALERMKPSLVLTEIMQPQDLSFIQLLHRRHHRLPILVFSFRDEMWYAPKALAAGACGYLMKNVEGTKLLAGIHNALNGCLVFSPEIRRRLSRRLPVNARRGHPGLTGKRRKNNCRSTDRCHRRGRQTMDRSSSNQGPDVFPLSAGCLAHWQERHKRE